MAGLVLLAVSLLSHAWLLAIVSVLIAFVPSRRYWRGVRDEFHRAFGR